MTRASRAVVVAVLVAVSFLAVTARALARWHTAGATISSIAYNQGAAFDRARDSFFFDGVSSSLNSGVYRTDSQLRLTGADIAVIPSTTEGYNHAGDLSFDPLKRRILLPLECYYPA